MNSLNIVDINPYHICFWNIFLHSVSCHFVEHFFCSAEAFQFDIVSLVCFCFCCMCCWCHIQKDTAKTNIHTFKLDLEKAEEQEIKLPTSVGSSKKQESSKKTYIFALLNMPKPLTVWITTNYGKFFKRWEHQTTLPASWEICMQVKKQQLEPDMEQWTGSKLGKEHVKAEYCNPLI